ncbi:response regulator receiver modulated metal dependent phosphohydrolase [Caballeronia catudaia]|uniref:Response regulator receiver modulated metal dependent phosphohydrolase n=1 Tax=Caballeronia catudaia TaxID=1777136 RepID=A0A158BQN0_9BURK|nr:response regulator receiver modulated metal dependent phosphohydrolase [Caballeronia catudaia]
MRSVLLVDDDVDSLLALRFVFEVHDYQVFVAQNGNTALDELSKHLPDLIVTDMEMPQLDGVELCRRLKCYPAFACVPIILISGGQPPAITPPVWDAFLTKPVDFYQLIAVTEQLPTFRLGPK